MTSMKPKSCFYGCRHWENKLWFDDKGVFRFGKCMNPKPHVSAEEAEKRNGDNLSYWEAKE